MHKELRKVQGGFSLMELIIAMTITLVVMGIASTMLARAFNVRTRANDNSDALADAHAASGTRSRATVVTVSCTEPSRS